MNARAVEMLEASIGHEHTVLCWFDFEGKRYAAYYQNPPSCSVARELLMERAEWTMQVLEEMKAGIREWGGRWEGKEFFAELAPAPPGSSRKWEHPCMLPWPKTSTKET